jgi:hypothetical protein
LPFESVSSSFYVPIKRLVQSVIPLQEDFASAIDFHFTTIILFFADLNAVAVTKSTNRSIPPVLEIGWCCFFCGFNVRVENEHRDIIVRFSEEDPTD